MWVNLCVCGSVVIGTWMYVYVFNNVCVGNCMLIYACVCVIRVLCIYAYMYVCNNGWVCILCAQVYMYICMWVCESVSVSSCVWWCVTTITSSFVQSKLGNGRFGFVPVNPIHWQFQDWHTRWFEDPYRFILYRSNDDWGPKSHHFISVFVLVLFPIYRCQ